MGTTIVGIVVSLIVVGFLFGTGFMILKAASAPSTPSPPALPAAQVMANRHSPLRDHDPERERQVGRVILTLVGLCFILLALGVFCVGLAVAGLAF